MMRTRLSRRRTRPATRGERGAALVEFAIVATFLVAMLGGAWDYGQGWRAGLSATEAARTGARVASGQGADIRADFAALTGMKSNLSSAGQLDNVERVVIFRVTNGNGGTVPTTCKTANAVAGCHIIQGAAFRNISSTWSASDYTSTGCLQAASGKGWCPTARVFAQLTADTVGVWVKLRQPNTFVWSGQYLTIERGASMRIEPA